ncbi:GNAT family N-acetyltransferase [Deminuibacter soli]|uniref:N-acetyltransferase n=1 Tax=Deminuibacter soli TaxID=2291815 RepID=A0A3E1NCQ0_9BACT|nr:GNAT family N-acetyltransferase [Deminuibacter soli]RFM25785.1 N-acetyltransferase [Deminuibacter soli]
MLTNATMQQLEQAAADNYKQLACLEALSCGGEVQEKDGLMWTYSGPDRGASILFPALTEQNAPVILDTIMDYYRAHPPADGGCWSLSPAQPAHLAAYLLARGFQPGWLPYWMALDLEAINDQHTTPADLQITPDNDTNIQHLADLPYAASTNMISQAFRDRNPAKAQRFLATYQGAVAGQSAVFFSTGTLGVAGIYNVGVQPNARGKGIGKAVTLAACLHAKEQGYRYAILNATDMGRHIYTPLGFQWTGDGITWWLAGKRYLTHPPSRQQIALAEATGKGDTAALDHLANTLTPAALNTPLTNKMTLMELAVHCKQPATAEWLIAHGALYTAINAWDLGWQERCAALLAQNPQEVNRRYREGNITLLHMAIQRNDTALAKLALAANPDLTLRDSWHNSTPLGWAMFFERAAVAAMIKAQGGTQ